MAKKQRLLITFEEAEDLYDRQKLSINFIAKSKGVHPDLLRRDLIYLGFKTRGIKEKINKFAYKLDTNENLEALALGLWLGEGTKRGKRVEITNCNPMILQVWIAYLIKVCDVEISKIKLRVSLHNPLIKEEAKKYWLERLGLEMNCFFSIKEIRQTHNKKQPMGTATVSYNSVGLIKKIQQRTVELSSSLM